MNGLQRILWQRLDADVRRTLGPNWWKRKIVLYGAGGLGASFLDTFPELDVAYFVDTDPNKDGTEFNGLPVHAPDYLRLENNEEIVVFITSSWHEEIRLELESIGLALGQHFFFGNQKAHGRIFLYLPSIDDFEEAFSWFNQNGASYVILRWFESLPDTVPEDIHILFETRDLELLFANPHLTSEPKGIQLEIYWTHPIGQEDELLSYPIGLADEILGSRTQGPLGAFVPSSSLYLKSLAFHVVFHKAENARLPISLEPESSQLSNKYTKQLSELATPLDVPLVISLEGLWDYLQSEDWLPPIDLGRRYATDLNSPWLRSLLAPEARMDQDVLVFVFREWLTQRPNVFNAVLREIEELGLRQIALAELNETEKQRAHIGIRGGNWIESEGSREGGGPSALGAFHDLNPDSPSPQDRLLRPFCSNRKLARKTELKKRICDAFNDGKLVNFLHSADDMREGPEYLDCLDPDRREATHAAIREATGIERLASPPTHSTHDTSEQSQTFVVYGAGANQVPVLEACRRRGWTVIAVDQNPDAPGATLADRFLCSSLRDHDQIAAALSKERIVGVAARVTDRAAIESSQRLSIEREAAAACPELVAASTGKVALASVCARAGLPTPRRYKQSEEIDWRNESVVLRPDVTVRGKAGIYRVKSQTEFDSHFMHAESASGNGAVDVSEWIDGVDVSVLAQLDSGTAQRIAIWDEWVALDDQGCISGVGTGFPSTFEGRFEEIDATLDALAGVFKESRCLVTLSLRIDPAGKAWIIEIHLGVGGDGLADQLIPAALPGFNAFDALVSACAGEPQKRPASAPRPRGLVRGESGWELIEARDVESLRAQGRAKVPSNWELPAALRTTHDDHATAGPRQGLPTTARSR